MQKNLPKIIILLLFLIIALILSAIFLLSNNKLPNLPSGPSQKITIHSNISPHVVKATPELDKKLTAVGFWRENATTLRVTGLPKITTKKLLINFKKMPKEGIDIGYTQADAEGNPLIGGNFQIEANGNNTINIFVSDKVFSLESPEKFVDSAFWNVFYLDFLFPTNVNGEDQFVVDTVSKANYFLLSK